MRVTNKMLSNSFLTDMRSNLENLQKLQQQMTSGKEISKPSDDPVKVARAMQLTTDINANKQYNQNISDTSNWLDTTDTSLGQVGDVLQKVRELLVSAGNAAYGSSERQSIKDEINQKVDQLTQVLNTNYDGKYVFAGTRGTTKPVQTVVNGSNNNIDYNTGVLITDPTYPTELSKINKKMNVEISQGVTMEYNVTAGDIMVFKNENGEDCDVRDLLKSITNHLDGTLNSGSTNPKYNDAPTDDATALLTGKDLQGITDSINNLLNVRAQVGAKQNRMESAKSKNEDETFNMTTILSKTEDIDITQKTMEYATLQNVYMASLQTSARVIQPTLLDYLK
jgi:flagellar hook-associated protein 3 FlgL